MGQFLYGWNRCLPQLDAVNGAIDISATSKDFIDSTSQGDFGKIGMFVFLWAINCSDSIVVQYKI